MQTMTIAQAARHLGVSDQRARQLIDNQELFTLDGFKPAKLSAEHVATVRLLRQQALLADLAARRRTPVMLAREVRRKLVPSNESGVNLPEYKAEAQRLRISLVPSEARQIFGGPSITAACVESGCRWCAARRYAELFGGWAPEAFGEGHAALFGGQLPCSEPECGPRLYGAAMRALKARVHAGGERPSEARTEPARPVMRAESRPARREAPAVAQPVQRGDDGKGMVQQRLKDVRTKLKTAERAGDRKYARELRQTLAALTADAARVDGRRVRPGRLRCGHLLAEDCQCPRRASKRARS